jgi:TolA-binding protein
MKLFSQVLLIAALAVPAFCQKPSPFPEPPPAPVTLPDPVNALSDQAVEMEIQAQKMAIDAQAVSADAAGAFDPATFKALTMEADALAKQFSGSVDIDQKLMRLDSGDLDEMKEAAMDLANDARIAFLQAPAAPAAPMPPRPKATTISPFRGRDDAYNAGERALDDHKYDEAVQHFDSAILQDSTKADGALYWKAYALNRLGKRDEALATIAKLRADYASSAWLRDAGALEAEVKQGNGQPISPAQESNDDLKLLAINSLMNADADRAIPLVDGILKGSGTPALKERALFVISQNKSPRAQQALLDYAKGGGNPDLQLKAIQYVGMSGTKDAQQQLLTIYTGSSDARVKNAIIQALMVAHANDALLNIAKSEKDAGLRGTAVRNLAMTRGVPVESLVELYGTSDAAGKREIINGLMAKGDAKTLVDLAHKETDPATKRLIVERLSNMRDNKDATDYMLELLK